ncbi:MAG: hypothetical protein U0Y10_16325 [Spirosomataceae bacterium]
MKSLEFKHPNSQRIYNDYMSRCKRVVHILSVHDQEECLMEVNSYLFEYLQNHQTEEEQTALLNIIERLGPPEVTLQEVVAIKKIDQAVRSYNLKHLVQALWLNLKNGVGYTILFVLTLLLIGFPIVIVMKLVNPSETGLWVGNGHFLFGTVTPQPGVVEVLGDFFIPVVSALCVGLYFFIIFLLKTIRNKKP